MIVCDLFFEKQDDIQAADLVSKLDSVNLQVDPLDEKAKNQEPEPDLRHKIRDSILTETKIFGQNRTYVWLVENPQENILFSEVPRSILNLMTTEQIALHSHNWVISKQDFDSQKCLTDFFNVIAVDDGLEQGYESNKDKVYKEFIMAIEAKDYPIFACLNHPEYQLLEFSSKKGEETFLIAKGISTALAKFECAEQ